MNQRHLVLTPGATGRDGIAGVTRLIVGALANGATPVTVLSMADSPGSTLGVGAGEVSLSGAGGRKLGFIASALSAALAPAPPAEVLCLHLGLSPLARVVARGRARLTVFLHGIEAWRRLGALQRWALDGADIVMANSEHTARRFRAANPALASRPVRICHLGVTVPSGANGPIAAPPDRAQTGPYALIVGRMAAEERYKGHDLLIDIWRRVQTEVPGARLLVAGDGDDRARLEASAGAVREHVRFLGTVDAGVLETLYGDCAFFVMPSPDEGFGLVFLEAMRAGKACIGGPGAAAEVIEDGVTGLVVDPAESEAVLKAVLRLFREPATRERMGRAGAERVAQRFSEEHFRRRFRAILGLPAGAA